MELKRINIVGGGPSGLYFAILMRETFPESKITVYERNRADSLAGWGVVINLGTVRLLQKCDPDSYQEIVKQAKHWSDIDIRHKGEQIRIRGKEYISISRNLLVTALRKRCQNLGVDILFDQKITDVDTVADCDLLVGADGARSTIRELYKDQFQTAVDYRKNRFIWLGTKRLFDTITHIIKETPAGIFSAECYIYSDTHSSFIPNCSEETWRSSGFHEMPIEESVACLGKVFEDELAGEPLLFDDASLWRQFPHITNRRWSYKNVLLLGDALRTAHFSIGSGTRLAIEDAIVAAQCISTCSPIAEAFNEFEKRRRPLMERLQNIAFESMHWFENIQDHIDLDIIPFTYQIMTRTSSLGERSLRLTDPDFLQRYQDYENSRRLQNG